MKLETKKQIDFASNMGFEGVDATISSDDMHKLWDILQDPYKNSIGAVVREYVSNSFDSHAEAKFIKENTLEKIREEYTIYNSVPDNELLELKSALEIFNNDPVHVAIKKDEGGFYWSTEDFGVGLSESRVVDVFASYLKSTKETSNNVIGAFGIGSKSGLSYTDIVYITTRYNGFEYQYFLRKGENGPRLDFVNKEPTLERNGTKIKIYIKSVQKYTWSSPEPEIDRFSEECKEQLMYFENVYFDSINGISNDFKLISGKNWIFNTAINTTDLTICLGKVNYPIDFKNLGIEPIRNFPLALKFGIGELDVIQTREDIKYTPKSKTAILQKIEDLKAEFTELWYKEGTPYYEDLLMYMQHRRDTPNLTIKGRKFNLHNLIGENTSLVYNKFKPFADIDFLAPKNSDLFFEYDIRHRLANGRLSALSVDVSYTIEKEYKVFRVQGNTDPKKNKYINTHLHNIVYLLRKKGRTTLKQYIKFLKLDKYPKKDWRVIIDTYQKTLQKEIIKNTTSYDRLQVPQDFLDSLKNTKKTRDKTIINASKYEFASGYNSYIINSTIKVTPEQIAKMRNKKVIICSHNNRKNMEALVHFYNFHLKVKNVSKYLERKHLFLTVAPTNLKYFENLPNVETYESIMKKVNKFKTLYTMMYLKDDPKLKHLFNNSYGGMTSYGVIQFLEKISGKLKSNLKQLETLKTAYSEKMPASENVYYKEFMEMIKLLGEKHNLLDMAIVNNLSDLANYFKGIKFITCLNSNELNDHMDEIVSIILLQNEAAIKNKKFSDVKHLNIQLKINSKVYGI